MKRSSARIRAALVLFKAPMKTLVQSVAHVYVLLVSVLGRKMKKDGMMKMSFLSSKHVIGAAKVYVTHAAVIKYAANATLSTAQYVPKWTG